MTQDKSILLAMVVAGLWLAIVAGRFLVAWLRLLRLRFGAGDMNVADRRAMPADVAAILDPAAARLAALGFEYQESLLIEPQLRGGDPKPIWADVFLHAASGSWATAQLAEVPEPGLSAAVVFLTNFADRLAVTENRRMHLFLPMPPDCDIADAGAASLAEQWAFHRRRLEALSAPVLAGREALRQRRQQLRGAVFAHCGQCGLMRQAGDDWRFTARGAWAYLRRLMAGNRRVAALPPSTDIEDPQLRLLADARAWRNQEAILEHNAMSLRGKVLWFLVSAAAGIVAFAYMASWDLVPVIVGVLLFHEFGHALAMRAVGYRSLSVLMLPFLGAVAIGRKDDAGPWQKLVVLLAGPLPGLVLAVVALRVAVAGSDGHELLTTVGAMALVINFVNLLPFTPLDGGQIVDTFLFARRPRLRFAFFALSAIALMATGVALESIAFTAVGLIFAMTLPSAWRRLRLLADSGRDAEGGDPVLAILKRVHEATDPRRPAFAVRMQTVRALLPLVRERAPRFRESLGGLAAYGATIILPIVALWDTGLPQQTYSQLARSSTVAHREPAAPDWKSALARAADPEARWQVLWQAGQWFEDNDDDTEARQRYEEALAETAKLPAGTLSELHALDTRIALARFSEPEVARSAYLALLPVLRGLPAAERLRLADVLEALNARDDGSRREEQTAYLREAIAVREAADAADTFRLNHDRIELARLIDSTGDAPGAEADGDAWKKGRGAGAHGSTLAITGGSRRGSKGR